MNATVTVFILLLACITAILVLRGGTPDADPGEEIEDLGIEIDEETKKILKELEEEEKKDQTLDCEGSWGEWCDCIKTCFRETEKTYFKETINQIQIANDFKKLLNKTI